MVLARLGVAPLLNGLRRHLFLREITKYPVTAMSMPARGESLHTTDCDNRDRSP